MRSELLRVQQEEMQRLHREFEVQLAGMKLQLQRANELHSREVSEYHLIDSRKTLCMSAGLARISKVGNQNVLQDLLK